MGNLAVVTPSTDARYPIAVLVSGRGTNLQALIDAAADARYAARIAVVISDRPGIRALARAEAASIPAIVVDWPGVAHRDAFTNALCDEARAHGAEALILAGFMRILAPTAIDRFPDRIINTHPALLPSFPGAHAIAEALAYGAKLTGVTVHFVDEEVDRGPIILQEAIRIGAGDDETTLRAKVQAVEHRVYPEVVDALARGLIDVDGRQVKWRPM